MKGRNLIAVVAGAAVVLVLAGSVAWAAIPSGGGTIDGCYTRIGGILRVIDKAKGQKCTVLEQPISWNEQGPAGEPGQPGAKGADGAPGTDPTVTQLAVGDAHCAAGGAAITDASGSTAYVCGGRDGADSAPSGTITSPNGEYSLSVTDAGVTISRGPNLQISLAGDEIVMRGVHLGITADDTASLLAGNSVIVEGEAFLRLRASGQVQVNSGSSCHPAARVGDSVAITSSTSGLITSGEPQVCIG